MRELAPGQGNRCALSSPPQIVSLLLSPSNRSRVLQALAPPPSTGSYRTAMGRTEQGAQSISLLVNGKTTLSGERLQPVILGRSLPRRWLCDRTLR